MKKMQKFCLLVVLGFVMSVPAAFAGEGQTGIYGKSCTCSFGEGQTGASATAGEGQTGTPAKTAGEGQTGASANKSYSVQLGGLSVTDYFGYLMNLVIYIL